MLRRFYLRLKLFKTLFFGAIVFYTCKLFALETDQFMTWGKKLKDSTPIINSYVNRKIRTTLRRINTSPINQRAELSCKDVHDMIVKEFNAKIVKGIGTTEIERLVAKGSLNIDIYPPANWGRSKTIDRSIYGNSFIFKLKTFGVSINMNNVYFGSDKLDHILTTGYAYYKIFHRHHVKRRKTEYQAIIKAIKMGIRQEKTYYGRMISGVFSFADLEANYQGFLFHRSFCNGKKPLLVSDNIYRWHLTKSANLRKYITPYLDESWSSSAYTRGRYKKVLPLLKKYCHKKHLIRKRLRYYNSIARESLSTKIIRQMIRRGKVPNPGKQTLRAICQ